MKQIILLLAIITFIGCTSLDVITNTTFVVSTNVSCNTDQCKTSIDGTKYTWDGSESIGLFISPFQTNVQFYHQCENTFWGTLNITGLVGNACYYAYYPYVDTMEDGLIKSEISFSQKAPFDSSNDFIVSQTRTVSYYEPNLFLPQLTFSNHLCPIMNVTIHNGNNDYKDYKLKQIIIYSDSTLLCGNISFDPREGTSCEAVFSGTSKHISLSYSKGAEPSFGLGNTSLHIVTIPCNVPDLKIKIVTDHGNVCFLASYSINFLPGKIFQMPPLDISDKIFSGDDRIPCIFMGDSITAFWPGKRPSFFSLNGFVGKGISGQWTSHMLARFQTDVIDKNPKAVIINGGVNDISHPYPSGDVNAILNNIVSMVNMATTAGIKPIVTTICPTGGSYKKLEPQIMEANALIKKYASDNELPLVDYHAVLVGDDGYMPSELASDGCHPTEAGYSLMEAACLPVIFEVLAE